MSQPFAVPSTIQPEISTPSLRVPELMTGEGIKTIPDWEYRQLSVWDILHTKLGISVATSTLTFGLLVYLNPPFVQEQGDNKIEIRKPSMSAIYSIAFVVFCVVFFVPLVPRSAGRVSP